MDDEIELSIALLLEAHADGTIDDEELLLLVSALDMEQRNEPVNYGPRLDLDSLTDKKCLEIFRFRKEEIRELCILFRLQNNFVFVNGTTWTAEEGLCVVLRRLSYPNRLVDLEGVFGRCATSLSQTPPPESLWHAPAFPHPSSPSASSLQLPRTSWRLPPQAS